MGEYSYLYNKSTHGGNCITGDGDHLYIYLKESIAKAVNIDIIVAFLMESGVKLLAEDFKEAVNRGTALRILCGNYLNITQPQALYLLKDFLGDKVDLRFYNNPNKSFHPKAYIFRYKDNGEIFIGSSNISRSALTDGIEWNYRICSDTSPQDYAHFKQTFDDLFFNQSIIVDDNEMRKYSKNWKKPKLFYDLEKLENRTTEDSGFKQSQFVAEMRSEYITDAQDEDRKRGIIIGYPRPMGPQIEALYELKKARLDGWNKGIVVAATGVGKTFLAAFDSKEFKKVLFVAHREEILFQAERTFKCVRPEISTGFFSGEQKDRECDVLFATVQTLGRREYLDDKIFSRDEFDYIVIDEFHHAVAESYVNIIEYFRPKFLLGLTATPERLDNQDVFALCDYNLVYEVRLKEAINKGWLVPFRYYGIYDEIDYSGIDYKNGKYNEKQLEQVLSINKRADLILQNYLKYKSQRALGFCSSRNHAVFMAKYFKDHGINACAVISGNGYSNLDDTQTYLYVVERNEAVKRLKTAEIKVIFSVDIFNEGLDVPEVDMVMFLRPTESPTIFLQQLGRGLRKKGEKKYVNVLDFIGNYKKANLIPFFLTGDIKERNEKSRMAYLPDEDEYPEGCFVDFDFRLVDIFKRMWHEQKNLFDKVKEEYFRVKEYLGDRPSRLSMYTYLDENIYSVIRTKKELNIFKDYLSFLDKIGELLPSEQALIGTKAHEFLKEIENTNMTKMYKMPVLLAFYNKGNMKLAIDENDIYESFREFYSHPSNAIDLMKDNNTSNYKEWGKKEYVNLAKKNPIKFLLQSSPDFFRERNGQFCLAPALDKYINNPAFIEHYKDIIDYRTRKFYKERLEKRYVDEGMDIVDN
ncbi:DEAD/DEAH box helicase family protein [Mahella australiensis]|uniref:Type III restriction protein res subunit n=1 Tax=Mahella australiensis (strain DSM 15567 / CIP 107919 / 50-1 BON) TaxID=697281 RepID=F3ZWJ1_MAHA5|nr:DEAD/DEAH box helicase family protein [Mahella australiensis]AEE95426.1 type III restriction protein res subunit [Mahella australiensis 50-1 BON]